MKPDIQPMIDQQDIALKLLLTFRNSDQKNGHTAHCSQLPKEAATSNTTDRLPNSQQLRK
jgi:hypothetical protein